ncbi:cholesteryl ester transfer protein-like isoform X2 [Hyla sarda]|uniref:cholesteryl ester transfer protein-like isoform X2 n=1 Tax=Hyla sarda TaxID=327740 RepID=UPI0024C34A38|nr:cholesteryl ester transfer protein-like isoform X2 [Hyla sarda]
MWPVILFSIYFLRISSACESPQKTGIVCRLTKPAALMLNEKTTEVIQAAFRHARFPDINGEKSVSFLGKVTYCLTNIQISDLSMENSEVELKEDAFEIMIKNVSASFKGTLNYGYEALFVKVEQSIDFEIVASTDLQVNTRLTCENNRIAADTSDCYLTFHKLLLHLHGNKEPGWFKQLFTDFISFTLKLVLKSQICKEINYVANFLASFIHDNAENFLSLEDIRTNVDITSFPIIKENYVETHHKGYLAYKNLNVFYNASTYSPSLLSDNRMLYFWFSEQLLDSLVLGYFLDQRLAVNLTGSELQDMQKKDKEESHQKILQEIFQEHPVKQTAIKVWSVTAPNIKITPKGTIVTALVAVQINTPSSTELYFEAETVTATQASYADRNLMLHPSDTSVHIKNVKSCLTASLNEEQINQFLQTLVSDFGIPVVAKRLGSALTYLMDSKGLKIFDIINPEILPHEDIFQTSA